MALFALYLATVAFLCFGEPGTGMTFPPEIFGIPTDKCVHFLMFAPFPVLGTIAFQYKSWWRTLCVSILTAVIIAFAFELLQSRVTETRTTDPADLNANILGIAFGLAVAIVGGLFRKKL